MRFWTVYREGWNDPPVTWEHTVKSLRGWLRRPNAKRIMEIAGLYHQDPFVRPPGQHSRVAMAHAAVCVMAEAESDERERQMALQAEQKELEQKRLAEEEVRKCPNCRDAGWYTDYPKGDEDRPKLRVLCDCLHGETLRAKNGEGWIEGHNQQAVDRYRFEGQQIRWSQLKCCGGA